MYKKILVPLDGSKLAEQVLPYARSLAEACGATITLLRVTDPDARMPFSASQSASDYLKYTAGSLQPLAVESMEKIGNPAEVIVDSAKAAADCLIAMATHGVTGPRRWFLGSVASKVVQSAANPILLIRPDENRPSAAPVALKRMIVPLDGSGLAERILPQAAALARTIKLEIQLLRAYSLPPNAYLVADGVIDHACFGDITALRMQLKGIAGIVIDGAARDAAVIRQMKFPVFLKGVTARNYHYPYGGNHGGVNVPIVCDGVAVNPGDVILGDDDGVVVVPQEQAIRIARTVEAELAEENVRKRGLTQWQPWPIEDVLRQRGYRFED